MKIHTSYFYQVRNMSPNQIPLSTAVFDPAWFHRFAGQQEYFVDKRHVLNGLRAPMFAPREESRHLCVGPASCGSDPYRCQFLQAYAEQLNTLCVVKVMEYFDNVVEFVRSVIDFEGEPEIMLLVHEAPANPCSERRVIQEWFRSHGITVLEWGHTKCNAV